MGEEQAPLRKRGVRASRVRLNKALIEAGLRTQNALAERIAELEALESAPRDLVNRIFREQPVAPASLERVARALGVPAHTLYLTRSDPVLAPSGANGTGQNSPAEPPSRHRRRGAWLAAGGLLVALVIAFGVVWNLPTSTAVGCRVHDLLHPPRTAPGRLGILVARFVHDPGNVAQYFLATNFINDAHLEPAVSVVALCRSLSLEGPGDLGARRVELRSEGREWLRQSGAAMLIWGRAEGDRLLVRFISRRQEGTPVTMALGGQPLAIEESQLQIPLALNRTASALPDIKRAALELMDLPNGNQAAERNRTVQSYTFSIDWLREAVIGGENLRRSLDAKLDPRRWAMVNADLCHEYRLLGDYEEEAQDFRDAESSCLEVIRVSPRGEFPLEWSSAQINLASAYVRLHRYAPDADAATKLLQAAEQALTAAGEVAQEHQDTQRAVLVQRNLGLVYLRLAELAEGKSADGDFQRAIELMQLALSRQNPAFQPLDWAITRQNLCLARHEWGARQGSSGIGLVQQAVEDCGAALHWLSRAQSPFDWAMAQNNLAISQAVLAQMQDDSVGLQAAIGSFEQAQTVYTRDAVPVQWAMVEVNLGELQCRVARADHTSFDPSVQHTGQALAVFIGKKMQRYQAYAQSQLEGVKACAIGGARCGCSGN